MSTENQVATGNLSTTDVWNSKVDSRKSSCESESNMSTEDWPALSETIEKVTRLVLVDGSETENEPPQVFEVSSAPNIMAESWGDTVPEIEDCLKLPRSTDSGCTPPLGNEPMARRKSSKASKLKWIPLPLPDLPPLKQRNGRRASTKPRSKKDSNGTELTININGSPNDPRPKMSPKAASRALSGKSFKGRRTTVASSCSSSINGDFPDFGPIGTPLQHHQPPMDFFMPYFVPARDYSQPQVIDDSTLITLLRNQIEYYFGEENLSRDFYLRRKMDSEGYLPIHLIASFQRVQRLTTDLTMVIQAIETSTVVEMKDGCIRTIFNPLRWPIMDNLPPSPVALMPHTTRSFSLPMPCAIGL